MNKDLQIVEQIAAEAGKCLLSFFKKDYKRTLKGDQSLVTDADLASNDLIVSSLNKFFPSDKIISEELLATHDRSAYKADEMVWIIDPLDGTTNFAHGFDYFCVSIGRARVTHDLEFLPDLGVVYAPVSKTCYSAQNGAGARRNGDVLMALREKPKDRPLEQCFLVTGFYYHKGAELEADVKRFSRVASECQSIRRTGSAALDLCLTADGIFDAYWEKGLKAWDVAAGLVILTEAGGIVKTYENQNYRLFDKSLVAGSPEIVDSIINLF